MLENKEKKQTLDLNITPQDIENLTIKPDETDNVIKTIPAESNLKKEDITNGYNLIENITITTGIMVVVCLIFIMVQTLFKKSVGRFIHKIKDKLLRRRLNKNKLKPYKE